MNNPSTTTAVPSSPELQQPLALFPLQSVLFPGALLPLKIFEARYLDLMSTCMRTQQPFGVVCLRAGAEAGRNKGGVLHVEEVGTLAHINEVDAEHTGILRVRCTGGQRFRIEGAPSERSNGLWVAEVSLIDDDATRLPGPAMLPTVQALGEAIRKLQDHDRHIFAEPYRLDDAGWVANRWCELLPVSDAAKQRLMALEDPVIRLSLVDGFLRDKKVIVG